MSKSYFDSLRAIAYLSALFSDSKTPYIHYRALENIYCTSFGAINLARHDTAFDALLQDGDKRIGVGLKTFIAPSSHSMEKLLNLIATRKR